MTERNKYRKGIFAVIYSRSPKGIEYLLLKRKLHWRGWEFVKGKIERFETMKMAAKREAKEETGQKILKIKKFNVHGSYRYKKILKDRPGKIGQTYSLFAIEVKRGKIKLDSKEHKGYKWVSFKDAIKHLKWPNQKKCLKRVNDWLRK